MNVTITNGQAVLSLSEPQEARMIEVAAAAYAKEKAEQEALSRVYLLKDLPARLKVSRTTLLKYLKLPQNQGGIRCRKVAGVWTVTELACREWMGDVK